MPTYEQKLEDAIVAAHEAGDTEAAQMLAQELKTWKPMRADVPAGDYAAGLAKGAIRGAADIGNTLINASTYIPRKIGDFVAGDGQSPLSKWNADRQASLNDWTESNQNSPLFTAGRIAGNIAGTAGASGVIAKGMQAVPAIAKYAPLVESGGFNLGRASTGSRVVDPALRAIGGAIQGGAQTAIADPDSALTGAAIGAATPGAVKLVGEAGKLINRATGGVISNILGATTGVGADAISTAYQSGKRGATDFLENMRGNIGFDDVVARAKEGLQEMRLSRQEAYRKGMAEVSKDKTVLDFAPIDSAVSKLASMGRFKGVQVNKNSAGVVDDIVQKVNEWKALDPTEYHTPEGFDALKQAIGDIRDTTQFGTAARRAADTAYNAVKSQITMQAPTYSKVMKDYSKASETLSEIESALSLGNKAKADTAIRKLQSLMRNNAQTNYGNRLSLANTLESQGGVDLLPSIAGQAMNSWTPRGMVGAIEKVGMTGAIPAGFFNPAVWAAAAATAPLASPRIIGNAAYGLGRTVGAGQSAAIAPLKMLGMQPGNGLLDPAIFARTLPLAISGSQIIQR